MGIGKRIKQAREHKHLTQKALAELIDASPSSIANYENEISHPKETALYKLIEALEVDANFLFQDSIDNLQIKTRSFDDERVWKLLMNNEDLYSLIKELMGLPEERRRATINYFLSLMQAVKNGEPF